MKLKQYQQAALESLNRYLEALASSKNLFEAWQKFWDYKATILYNDAITGAAKICLKIPTGGGKTFLACAALNEIFLRLPREKKLVVWLVPSEAILTQTLENLSDENHAYRQRLNTDFGGKVEVLSKENLLQGQNFSPATVAENLTICVMSYASLRIDSQKKDIRKVYQENGALINFANSLGDKEISLINVLREMQPVVIVDESHNADSELSAEMLKNLNPSFILELTATPKNSNIIFEVSGAALKAEQMIKLPVIVYPPKEKSDLIRAVIAQREMLEKLAEEEEIFSRYIRPIALIQAEPANKNDSETFDRVKKDLIDAGIPADQIAIKTSNVNTLKDENLLDKGCPIRYIITINALKEGWDCPFAYILASLANKNSEIDVAQIVGRILRQPYAAASYHVNLNQAYVFSTHKDFNQTVQSVINGLETAGLPKSESQANVKTAPPKSDNAPPPPKFSAEINSSFSDSVKDLQIPQFFIRVGKFQTNAFNPAENGAELLSKENLSSGFNLAGADTQIDLSDEVLKIDVDDAGRQVISNLSIKTLADYQRNFIDKKSPAEQLNFYANSLARYLRENTIPIEDLKNYVRRVIEGLSKDERDALSLANISFFAAAIRKKIRQLKTVYRRKNFDTLIDAKKIFCKKNYQLKKSVSLINSRGGIEKALYDSEGDMNEFERKLILQIAGLENVTWWHRNIEQQEFYLNGWLNHYPDFIVRTDSGKIILVEAKGDYLNNDDTAEKISLGREWQARAGDNFRYFMVFESKDISGAYSFQKFLGVLSDL